MTRELKMTPWQRHKIEWGEGCGGEVCARANKVVLCRGKIPCDVLWIGEAPGKSEDVLGIPFCPGAPAGQLLEQMIATAKEQAGKPNLACAFTNLIGCIPLDEDGQKVEKPESKDVQRCTPRLLDLIDNVLRPRLIVTVGADPTRWFDAAKVGAKKVITPADLNVKVVSMDHPAGILRLPLANRGFVTQRNVVALTNFFEDL